MNVDWECADCGIVYRADVDAGRPLPGGRVAGTDFGELPVFCPECGDHAGWERRQEE